jgi:hypothetical protein
MLKYFSYLVLAGQVITHLTFCQSYKAEVIDYKTTCSVEKNKLTTVISYLIQINNKTGDEFAEISIQYQKDNKVVIDHAWIEDTAGTVIRKLRNKDIFDVSAFESYTLYQDYYIKKFSLYHNIYPYRINYEFSFTENQFIEICDWDPVRDIDIPTQHAELNVRIPAGYQINIHQKNISLNDQKTQIDATEYQWVASYKQLFMPEYYSPPIEDYFPSVIIVPLNFNYGVDGSTKDWASYGNWKYRLIKGGNILPPSEQAEVQRIINACPGTKDKVIGLYHYLEDHTRYINVTMDVGGFKPYPASYVAQNKYGDCKALTNYLKSILEYAAIPSFYTNIYAARIPQKLILDFPSQQFNHVILTVPLEKDTIWLETTNNVNPFGYVGTGIQNRKALLVEETNSHLIDLPVLLPKDVLTERAVRMKITENTTVQVNLKCTMRGESFELFNDNISVKNYKDQDEFIKKNFSANNFEIQNWEITKAHRDSAFIGLNLSAINHFYLKNYGPYKALSLFELICPVLDPVSKRTLPVFFPYPFNRKDSVTIEFPENLKAGTIPSDTIMISKFGEYSRKAILNNSKLTVLKHLVIFSGNYPLSDYPDLFNFLESVRKEEKKMILFK